MLLYVLFHFDCVFELIVARRLCSCFCLCGLCVCLCALCSHVGDVTDPEKQKLLLEATHIYAFDYLFKERTQRLLLPFSNTQITQA